MQRCETQIGSYLQSVSYLGKPLLWVHWQLRIKSECLSSYVWKGCTIDEDEKALLYDLEGGLSQVLFVRVMLYNSAYGKHRALGVGYLGESWHDSCLLHVAAHWHLQAAAFISRGASPLPRPNILCLPSPQAAGEFRQSTSCEVEIQCQMLQPMDLDARCWAWRGVNTLHDDGIRRPPCCCCIAEHEYQIWKNY